MMLNNRQSFISIFVIFYVLFVVSTALGQQPDSALSASQFMQIIDRIDKVEDNMLDHVDKKIDGLDKKIDGLETKFHELDKKVAVLRSDVDKLFTIIIGIAGAVGIHLIIFIASHIYTFWRNKTNIATKAAPNNRKPHEVLLRQAYDMDVEQSDSRLPEE